MGFMRQLLPIGLAVGLGVANGVFKLRICVTSGTPDLHILGYYVFKPAFAEQQSQPLDLDAQSKQKAGADQPAPASRPEEKTSTKS